MKHSLASPPRARIDVVPTTREVRWLAHIDRHGPQSSEFLFELTRNTHCCRDTALRRLQILREAGYLRLPQQQRQIAKADFNPFVYDLTRLGWDVLLDHKDSERHCRPTGHWWHGYWVSAVSSATEICALRAGSAYTPAARILAIRDVAPGIPVGRTMLIPDQLFAIRYSGGYRALALEVDRGTEPVRSGAARKSLKRSVEQYRQVFDHQLHKTHFGLKSKMAVLWVFTNPGRQGQFLNLLDAASPQFLTASVVGPVPRFDEVTRVIRAALGL